MRAVLQFLGDDELASSLEGIAKALRGTVAMPRAAEAIDEAARRLKTKEIENAESI